MLQYWLYRAAQLISCGLPRQLAYWVGLRIADGYFARCHRDRRAVMSNLRHIFEARGITPAEQALYGLARKTYQYFGKYLVDFFRFSALSPDWIRQMISLEHLDYLRQSADTGRGVLAVTAHFGNWELGGAVMASLGYCVNAVALPQRMEKINRLFQNQRTKRGMRVIQLGASPFGTARCLKRGELVALLADRDFSGRAEPIEFFGHPARMPSGPAWLAMKTHALVLPGFLLRQVDDSFLLRFHPPIDPDVEGSVEAVRQKICRGLEREIGENPYQWFIFDDFWAARSNDKQGVQEHGTRGR